MTDLISVTVGDGKYTVRQTAPGKWEALRYGEAWPAYPNGPDNLHVSLAYEVDALRAALAAAPSHSTHVMTSDADLRQAVGMLLVTIKRLRKWLGIALARNEEIAFDSAVSTVTALWSETASSAKTMGEILQEQLEVPRLRPASSAKRHTFTIPEGHEAVRDADGRATGETRPKLQLSENDDEPV